MTRSSLSRSSSTSSLASGFNLKTLSPASGKPSALASGRSKLSVKEPASPKGLRHRLSALLGEKGSGLIQNMEKAGSAKSGSAMKQENPVARLKLLLV
jgi:hydroxymethylglutaryl-CoA reductase (NADPH)